MQKQIVYETLRNEKLNAGKNEKTFLEQKSVVKLLPILHASKPLKYKKLNNCTDIAIKNDSISSSRNSLNSLGRNEMREVKKKNVKEHMLFEARRSSQNSDSYYRDTRINEISPIKQNSSLRSFKLIDVT